MATVPAEAVLSILKQLSHDLRDLDVGTSVDRHQKLPVVQFLRDYVSANKPVVLTSVVSHWPAYTAWTDDYLCSVAGDTEVTVALTPNGRADAVTPLPGSGSAGVSGQSSRTTSPGSTSPTAAQPEMPAGLDPGAEAGLDSKCSSGSRGKAGAGAKAECFALPHQVKMPLRDFLELLRSSRSKPAATNGGAAAGLPSAGSSAPGVVPYLQYQNSSLTAEVPQLLGDVDLLLSWATQAFGGLPEAVNLWIGDERSVTSWHKDPFENIYAVVAGSKTFTLMPPADLFRMRLKQYRQASYKPAAGLVPPSDSPEGMEYLTSGVVPLVPVLEDPPERVLWSSVLPSRDQVKAKAKAAAGAAAAAVSVGGAGTAVGGDAAAAGAAGAADAAGSQQAQQQDLFSDPSLPPPIRVTVKAGEALYLPAMWWHQVEQEPDETGRAIAVNYWYDMKFDAKQAFLSAVDRLAELLGLNEAPPPPPAPRSDLSDSQQVQQAAQQAAQLRPPYHTTRAFG